MAPRIVLCTLAASCLVLTSSLRAADPVAKSTTSPNAARPPATYAKGSPQDAILHAPVIARNFNGVVVDEAGAPVSRATVTLYAPYFLKSVSTGPDGQFWLQGESVGGYLLIARNAAGDRQAFRPRESADGNITELGPVRLVLKQARHIDLRVSDQSGKPISGASVAAVANLLIIADGKTDTAGNAFLRVPAGLPLQEVFARKQGFGVDFISTSREELRPEKPNARTLPQRTDKPLELRLTPADTVHLHVVDQNGKPLARVRVLPSSFWLPGRGFLSFVTPTDDAFQPQTDAGGVATLSFVPRGGNARVTARTDSHWASTFPIVGTRANATENKSGETAHDAMKPGAMKPGDATIVVYRREPVRGTVVTPEGKPAAGAKVEVSGTSYLFDFLQNSAVSDAHGTFEVWLSPESYYAFEARADKDVAPLQRRIVRAGVPVEPLKFVLAHGTRVHGRVIRAKDKSPLAGLFVGLHPTMTNEYYKLPMDQQLANPGNSRHGIVAQIYHSMQSGPDGQFEFYVAPGQYTVQLNTLWRTDPVQIDVARQKDLVVDLADDRPEKGKLKGRVVLKSDPTRGVPQAKVEGVDLASDFGNRFTVTADRDGRFEVDRGQVDMWVWAGSDNLAGAVRIAAADKTATVPVEPTASVTGTLIDGATGRPAANREIDVAVRIPVRGGVGFSWNFIQRGTTEANGRFTVKNLVIGLSYDAHAEVERNEMGPFSWRAIGEVTPKDDRPIDLGECKLPPPYKPTRPPTLEESITRALKSDKPLDVRLDEALYDARLFENRILILATSPKSVACRRIFGILYGDDSHVGDEQAREALGNFTRISIDASAPRYAAELTPFLARWNLTSPAPDDALLAVIDQQGRLVSATTAKELWPKRIRNGDALAAFLKKHEGPVPDAQSRLDEALARAKRENKRVLVEESASWCVWCHVLARYLDHHRSLIEKDYVWLLVDPRFTHGEAVIKKLRKAEGGIPWMVILDADGKPLITSDAAEGNIGYPSDPSGNKHFEKMLRTTARHLSDIEIKLLLADAAKK